MQSEKQHDGLESLLSEGKFPDQSLEDIVRLIYGRRLQQLAFNNDLADIANTGNFELRGYSIKADPEQLRRPRRVKIAAIQNQIVAPTSAPIAEQRAALHERIGLMVEVAAQAGARIICMQEAWTMPFAFCTRERLPWTEFAESAEDGPTTKFLSQLAKKAWRCDYLSNSRA